MNNIGFFIDEVREFRAVTGLPMASDTVNHLLHVRLFAEEAFEFVSAKTLRDKADALADMIVIACGYWLDAGENTTLSVPSIVAEIEAVAWDLGINIIGAFKLVHESNMSKVCSWENVVETCKKFQQIGISTEWRRSFKRKKRVFAVYSAGDYAEYPRGKLLKPLGYFKPQWHQEDKWMVPVSHMEHGATAAQLKEATAGVLRELDNIDPLKEGTRQVIEHFRDHGTLTIKDQETGEVIAEVTPPRVLPDPVTEAAKSLSEVQAALNGKFDVPLNQKDPRK